MIVQVGAQLKLFDLGEEPVPGVTAIHTPWHTPGSVAFRIREGGDEVVVSGDGLTHRVLSIENPGFGIVADYNQTSAPSGRHELLDKVVAGRSLLLGGHAAFPALLYLEHQGLNYQSTAAPWLGSADAMSVCA
jgi:glyoxylase-like metal-dependent hydrolase (beta-lactamase superfamily II)